MVEIKNHTSLEQSKMLAEILPLESADMLFQLGENKYADSIRVPLTKEHWEQMMPAINPCWSLTALLNVLSEIKPQVYTPILFPSEGKWILQFAEYGHGNICEVTCDNPVDACYEMIIKLHEQKLL